MITLRDSPARLETTRSGPGGFGVRRRLLLALLAGRGAFRATSQLAPLVLAVAWGPVRFGEYAGAVGLSAWTMFIAVSGEKAALKLLPRARRVRDDVARVALAIGATPLVCASLALGAGLAFTASSTVRLLLAALVWSAGVGLLQVAAGLHRLRGAHTHDAAAFLSLAFVVAVVTILTIHYGWSPLRQLASVSLAALVICAVMLLRLPVRWLRPVHASRPGIGVLVLRTALLLGVPELLGSVSVAVCYLALSLTGQRTQISAFFAAAVVSGICSAALIYLFRLGQPATSARLRGSGNAIGRRQANRVLTFAIATSVACSIALAATVLSGIDQLAPGWLLLAALTSVEIPLFALVSYASYLLENTDGRAPAITSGAAVAGLCAVALVAIVLVPRIGAAGAMGSLVIGLGAIAVGLRFGVSRRYRGAP